MAHKHQIWSSNKKTRVRAQRSWRRTANASIRNMMLPNHKPHNAKKQNNGTPFVRVTLLPNPVLSNDQAEPLPPDSDRGRH